MQNPQTGVSRRWSMRPIRYSNDLERLAELAAVTYPHDIPLTKLDHLRWKYLENPAGRAIGVVCESDGVIIGADAFFPAIVKIGNATKRCVIPGDTMVHPRFQRQGMYIAMERFLENAANDVSMKYALSASLEQPTVRGALKYLASMHCGDVHAVSNALSMSSNTGGVSGRGGNVKVREIAPLVFGSEFNDLWRQVKDSLQVAVVRDANFLNWRFSMPGYPYIGFRADENDILCGYCVILFIPYDTSYRTYYASDSLRVGWILDILAKSSEVAESLVEAGIVRAKEVRAQALMTFQTAVLPFVSRLGFVPVIGWQRTLCAQVRSRDISEELITNMSNWYITPGDSDWV